MRGHRQKRERPILCWVWLLAPQFGATIAVAILFYDFVIRGSNADIFSTVSGPAAREVFREAVRDYPLSYFARMLLAGGVSAIFFGVVGTIWTLRASAARIESRRREEAGQAPCGATTEAPHEDIRPSRTESHFDAPPKESAACECPPPTQERGKDFALVLFPAANAAMVGLIWTLIGGVNYFEAEAPWLFGMQLVMGGTFLAFAVAVGSWAGARWLAQRRR